jgi:hypothetical protein
MALREHNHDITRRYLLGQLTDEEEQNVEERLLTDDEFFEELAVTKDELTQEYVNGELTGKERDWLRSNFLVSAEGKEKHEFAKAFASFAQTRAKGQKKTGVIERLWSFFAGQPIAVLATSGAVLVIAITITSLIRTSSQPSVATLTLISTSTTRSANESPIPSVQLKEDVLKLTLILPQSVPPATAYRAELLDDKGSTKTLESVSHESGAAVVNIGAGELRRGQYAVTLSALDDSGGVTRIPGSYYFAIQ